MLRPWLELARVSNLPTVWTNILAAWLLAGGKWDWKPLTWLMAGGSLIYTGGMFLNDAADVKFDREHRKERPIPSGRITLTQAWIAALGFLAAGFIMFVWGAEACIWLTGALVAAIVVYDLYHKPWPGSVFIMGSCRTLLYLATASAVTGTLSWNDNRELCVKAIALGAYIVGLTFAARSESKTNQGHGGIAIRWGLVMTAAAWIGLWYAFPGSKTAWLLCIALVALWSLLVGGRAVRLMRTPPPSNIGHAVGLLLAGIVLIDAIAVCSIAPIAALCFAASFPLVLLWQRKIAAT